MPKITTTKTHTSGIALGGIGTGSVELFPDGEFHYWQIANPPRFTRVSWESKVDDGEESAGALSFWVREKRGDGSVVVRKLGMKTDAEDFTYRMFAWNKPVERIDFDGRFPLCDLNYIDSKLTCSVSLRALSPFVPHDSDLSATPGFYLDYTVENPTDEAVEISLMGALEPNFANKKDGWQNVLYPMGRGFGVHMEPVSMTEDADCGNVCLSVDGDGEKSYITAEHYRYLKEYIGFSEFGVTQESFLFAFRESGELPDSKVGKRPQAIAESLDELDDAMLDQMCRDYLKYPFAVSVFNRIRYCNPDYLQSREDKISFLKCCLQQTERMGDAFGSCALCSKLILAPGETKNIRFVLTWYFPNHFSEDGKKLGHYYENLYGNALEANRFLLENHDSICEKVTAFTELLYDTDLSEIYADSCSSNLSQLVKCSNYIKNGNFGLWEGLGYCGFHTTDITYHASFGLINLFPDLHKKQMKTGAGFQREDGRVHHVILPDFESVDNGYDRVDMNMQFVLMVLRDYLFTGDREYLLSLWDNVKKAMDSIEELDRDDDGLPDHDTKRNTYDAWNFSGASAYISILWLAALKAAVMIAQKAEDTLRAEKWSCLLEKGKHSLEEKLWNGEYYNLWVNGDQTDESLMTDQLDGEWFLRMMGIGGNLSDDRIRKVIQTIFDKNFDAEAGLVNASCSEHKKTTMHTYKNCQAGAVWTGIGYVFSALAFSVGLDEISDRITASIYDNQLRLGYFWAHWECGPYYTRPMSSWSLLHAALGLSVDYEAKKMALKPVKQNVTLPLVLPGILAKVHFADQKADIKCMQGNMDGWEITIQ